MTLVALLSVCAMVLGFCGIMPQLVRMVRARSAGGRAPLGWAMGMAAHMAMAYVNFFGFHSSLLGASSLTAGSLCGVAIVLIRVVGRRAEPAVAATPLPALDQMATGESPSRLRRPAQATRCAGRCGLESFGSERVARGGVAITAPALESRAALSRRAVRERVGIDLPAGLPLHAVIADRV